MKKVLLVLGLLSLSVSGYSAEKNRKPTSTCESQGKVQKVTGYKVGGTAGSSLKFEIQNETFVSDNQDVTNVVMLAFSQNFSLCIERSHEEVIHMGVGISENFATKVSVSK